ncbi:Ank2, partial [Symbiodinium sp. KB8]
GSAVSWGSLNTDTTWVQEELYEVVSLQATSTAFTAVRRNGSIVTWGDLSRGGQRQSQLHGVRQVQASLTAFAALLEDGSLATWGHLAGQDLESHRQDVCVRSISASNHAFAAILQDGSILAWGSVNFDGDCSNVRMQLQGVQRIQATRAAFAAILADGSVVTWGNRDAGGDSSSVQTKLCDVQHTQATQGAFAAVLGDMSAVSWGDEGYGGDDSEVQKQLQGVQHIQASYAALLHNGSVVTWGSSESGGDSSSVQNQLNNVQEIQATNDSFAAILSDGSVVTWGNSFSGGNSDSVQDQLQNVQAIQATRSAFAALCGDGSIVTWGLDSAGGDSSFARETMQPPAGRKRKLELKAFSEQRTRSDGMTPLHCAARSSSVEALQILLRLDATVDRQDSNSWAPLHHAVDAGQLPLVEVLLEARAPIDQLTTCWAPLHFAVVKGYTKIVELLSKRGADMNARTAQEDASTPLHFAAAGGEGRVIGLLQRGGATPNLTLEGGWTPLHVAALLNKKEVIKVIIRGKADPQQPLAADGITALHIAIAAKHEEIVTQLLKAYADSEAKMTGAVTALHLAAATGHTAPAKALLSCRAFVDANRTCDQATALTLAAEHGFADVAQVLLQAGAQANFRRVDGVAPLHLAAGLGNAALCKALLQARAHCSIQVDDGIRRSSHYTKVGGETPLHFAAEGGYEQAVAVLLEAQAELDRPSTDGRTPIHMAAYTGHATVCQLLLEARTPPDITMPKGWTALHLAAHRGFGEVIDVLITGGASVDAATDDGWTPLFMAAKEDQEDAADRLVRAGAQPSTATAAAAKTTLGPLARTVTSVLGEIARGCGCLGELGFLMQFRVRRRTDLRQLVKQSHWDAALTLLRAKHGATLLKHGTAAITSAGEARVWEAVLLLWSAVADATGHEAAANAAISALCKSSQWQLAAACLVDGRISSQDVAFGLAGYGAAIAACGNAAAWSHAVEVLDALHAKRVAPNSLCYSAAIAACGKSYEWQLCLELLQQALQGRPSAAERCRRTLGALQALQVAQQWEQAVALLASSWRIMRNDLLPAVLEACARSAAWRATLQLLGSDRTSEDALLALRACARSTQWQECLHLYHDTADERMAAEAHTTLLSALTNAQAWRHSLRVFASLSSRQLRADEGVAHVLRALGMARQWNEALELLHSSQCQSDDWCLSAAVWACQVAGATDVASELLSQRLEQERASRRKRKEVRLLEHLEQTAVRDCPASVISCLEQFATENSWLKVAGGEKAKVLEAAVRPTDRVLEIGAYVGYSALRLSLLRDGRQQVRAIEADPINAAVAQEVLHLAGVMESVQLRVGRACDWLASGCLDAVDVLILDHRGTVYHEDLAHAEPLLSEGARVLADNVLHPGAPMFLLAVQDRYEVEVHVLKEFGMPEVEDWLLVCTPKTWPVEPSKSDYASLKFAEMRRWAVEVNRLCHQSQTGYVEWRSLQSRMRPVLMASLATLDSPHPGAEKGTTTGEVEDSGNELWPRLYNNYDASAPRALAH